MREHLLLLALAMLISAAARVACQPPPSKARLGGVVLASDGATSVPDVRVWLARQIDKDGGAAGRKRWTIADSEGRFFFGEVVEGEYVMWTELSSTRKAASVRGNRDAQVRLVLVDHHPVRGRLVAPEGRAMRGKRVRLWASYARVFCAPMPVRLLDGSTLEAILPEASEMDLELHVPAVGWWFERGLRLAERGDDLGEIQLQPGGALSAVVENRETGEPLRDAKLMACQLGPLALGDGYYRYELSRAADERKSLDGLRPTRYVVRASSPGFLSQSSAELVVRAGETTEVALKLDPAARLSGVVLAPPGATPPKSSVSGGRWRGARVSRLPRANERS